MFRFQWLFSLPTHLLIADKKCSFLESRVVGRRVLLLFGGRGVREANINYPQKLGKVNQLLALGTCCCCQLAKFEHNSFSVCISVHKSTWTLASSTKILNLSILTYQVAICGCCGKLGILQKVFNKMLVLGCRPISEQELTNSLSNEKVAPAHQSH